MINHLSKLLFLLLISLHSLKGQSQEYLINQGTNLSNDSNFLRSELFIKSSSSSLKNEFIQQYQLNRFLTNNIKENALDGLNNNNLYGWESNGKLAYFNLSGDFNYSIHLNHKTLRKAYFTKDLFKLILFGNNYLRGQNAQIAPLNYQDLQYSELGFTWYSNQQKGKSWRFFGGINFIKGLRNNNIEITNSNLFTSQSGDSINLSANVDRQEAGAGSREFYQFNGIGASLKGGVFWSHPSKEREVLLQFSDLGIINWQQNPIKLTLDTSVNFEGVDLNNFGSSIDRIRNFSDSLINRIVEDGSKKAYTTFLPFSVNLHLKEQVNFWSNTYIHGKISYLNTKYYIPYFQVYLEKHAIPQKLWLQAGLNYGGFGAYGLRLQGTYHINKNWRLKLGTENLIGLILPSRTNALSGLAKLDYSF